MRSDVEETENHKDVTDSGYSNSCSNSQSQRSGSSKCSGRNSAGSSGSGSSTFGVLASPLDGPQKEGKDRKDKKKDQEKKSKRKKNPIGEGSSTTLCTLVDDDAKFTNSFATTDSLPTQISAPQLMETGVQSEVLQVAALSHTLHNMRKMKYQDTKSDDSEGSVKDEKAVNLKNHQPGEKPTSGMTEQIAAIKTDTLHHEGELRIAVSILDGVVIFTSGLTQALGYPKDMWVGRSLIDFVHPKHRASFASFIIQSIAELIPGGTIMGSQRNVYFCCLRKYKGLKNGFQVNEQRVGYLPCQITLQFKELPPVGETSCKECLIITAMPVRSAYKYPDETRMSPKFMTRHSFNCQLVHVDPEVMPYFGFLPQDMLTRSILGFYHPEDLHFLKEVYEAVIKEQGHPFRSKPYRFLCQNGGYALVETELSSFINPWTRKLEFIIGQHSVLRGPSNPDVTSPCSGSQPVNISEEVLKESIVVQEEIKCLLNETTVRSTETAKQQVSKRCKDLAAFMENLMDEITKPPDLKIIVPTEEQSFSERDSVMLGEISPHHDYFDGKSVSETPPSYNQLNYNENIHRFFESKPKTSASEQSSGSGGDNTTGSSGEEGKTTPTNNSSSGSGSKSDSGANSGQSTESNGNSGETTSYETSNNSNSGAYKPPALTEQLLSRHNEDMEKQMVQKHRVSRTKSDHGSKVKERLKTVGKGQEMKYSGDEPAGVVCQGLKRSRSHSWEGEPYKTIKASHVPVLQQVNSQQHLLAEPTLPTSTVANTLVGPSNPVVVQPGPHIAGTTSGSKIWSPFPVGPPTHANGNSSQEFPSAAMAGTLMPMYYHVPNQRNTEISHLPAQHTPISYPQPSVQLMPSLLYSPFMYGTPPIQIYSPVMYPPDGYSLNNNCNVHLPEQHPITIKTEPRLITQAGPTRGPHAPSNERPTLNTLKSSDNEGGSNEISTPYDDSSYQSSFYSFLKTDKSDESMRSSSENERHEEHEWGTRQAANYRPVRKVAPWIENVNVTSDLMMKYQLKERGLDEMLQDDALTLANIKQPSLVNDQLSQMYQDLELEGLSKALTLEEGITSSSESSGDDYVQKRTSQTSSSIKRRKRYMEYDKMTILFEEDAPMPPPTAAQYL